jgi:recombinational DNA repair ATPase RecF
MASEYQPELKAQALAIYTDHGGAEASRETGVPATTIRSWAHRAGVATVATEKTRAATEAARLRWKERRMELAHRVGEQAEEALRRTAMEIKSGKTSDAKNMATALAILIDKAQLLTGGSANRREHIDPEYLERRARELDELARRRAERPPGTSPDIRLT